MGHCSITKGTLDGTRGSNCIPGPLKNGKTAVAFAAWTNQRAGMLIYQQPDQFVMSYRACLHVDGMVFPQPRAALHVSEQKCERSCRDRPLAFITLVRFERRSGDSGWGYAEALPGSRRGGGTGPLLPRASFASPTTSRSPPQTAAAPDPLLQADT